MACWQDTIVLTLRGIIDDMGDNPRYSDESLQNLICISAMMITMGLDFNNNYVVNIGLKTISPDPGSDNDFVILCAMKAACMIANSTQRKDGSKAVVVRDGPSSIDGRPAADATARWADKVCKDYERAELNFKVGNGAEGRAIIGPYRIETTSGRNVYPDNRSYTNTYFE